MSGLETFNDEHSSSSHTPVPHSHSPLTSLEYPTKPQSPSPSSPEIVSSILTSIIDSIINTSNTPTSKTNETLPTVQSDRIRKQCLHALDHCITQIKRKSRSKEPTRVIRFIRNTKSLQNRITQQTLTALLTKIESNEKNKRKRQLISSGAKLPNLYDVEIRPCVRGVLEGMCSWIEQSVEGEDFAGRAASLKGGEIEEVEMRNSREMEGEVEGVRERYRRRNENDNETKTEGGGDEDEDVKAVKVKYSKSLSFQISKIEAKYTRAIDGAKAKSLDKTLPSSSSSSSRGSPWPSFIHTITADPSMNYLADEIMQYLPSNDHNKLSHACKRFHGWNKYYTNRDQHATRLQTSYRRVLAMRALSYLKNSYKCAVLIQRVTRGHHGRLRFKSNNDKKALRQNLTAIIGSKQSLVHMFLNDTHTHKHNDVTSYTSAVDAIDVIGRSKGGSSLLRDTSLGAICAHRLKLALVVSTANNNSNPNSNSDSEWISIVKMIGNLGVNAETRRLVVELEGGKSMVRMIERGRAGERGGLEVAVAVEKLCKDKVLLKYFVEEVKVGVVFVHMLQKHQQQRKEKKMMRMMKEKKSWKHQLLAIKVLARVMNGGYDLGDILPILIDTIQTLVESTSERERSKYTETETSLLRTAARTLWKSLELIKTPPNNNSVPETIGGCIRAMLTSDWTLSNSLGCILTACIVRTAFGKRVVHECVGTSRLIELMSSGCEDVRVAAGVALEAFAAKAKERGEREWGEGENATLLPVDVSRAAILVKHPAGLEMLHHGKSISDVTQYRRQGNIVLLPIDEDGVKGTSRVKRTVLLEEEGGSVKDLKRSKKDSSKVKKTMKNGENLGERVGNADSNLNDDYERGGFMGLALTGGGGKERMEEEGHKKQALVEAEEIFSRNFALRRARTIRKISRTASGL